MKRILCMTLATVLLLGLCACGSIFPSASAESNESSSADAEAAPNTVQAYESVDVFYPELNDSYRGVAVPVPDGSEKLVRVTLSHQMGIPVVANMVYAEDGSFTGAVTSFDGVAAYEDRRNDEHTETDEQGRLTLDDDPKRASGRVFAYEYAEDGQSYKMITINGGDRNEEAFNLEDWQITDWVRYRMDEVWENFACEYDEEGLLVRVDTGWETADLRYYWETDADVRVDGVQYKGCTVLKQENDNGQGNPRAMNYLVFDSHGYLIYYSPLLFYAGYTCKYLYE